MRNAEFARDAARNERDWGVVTPFANDYLRDEWRQDLALAMDAQPTLQTQPSAGIPIQLFTSIVDPEVIRIFQTPNFGAQILGEMKKGTWLDQTAFFPVVENTGFIASYSDFSESGKSDANANFVQRQSYLYQTHIEYGDLEVERAGAAALSWVSELQMSAALTLDKFQDYSYHFGVQGLQNYGILNDPSLSAALTPSTKAAGGAKWMTTGGGVNATPNEVYNDLLALYAQLQLQAPGYVQENAEMVLVLPPISSPALGSLNSFGLMAEDQIKRRFRNLSIIIDPRYQTASGNVIQLILKKINGRQTGYCAFNEKMRDHRVVPATSSMRQKKTAGTWGAIVRYPLSIASMIGI